MMRSRKSRRGNKQGGNMEALYTASATARGGRNGTVESSDGILDLDLTMPKEMGGPGDEGATNTEQLFAAGYSACFENALRRVAGQQKKNIGEDTSITANVGIGRDGNGFGLKVELVGHLPGLPREEAEALMYVAHEVCPYSKATRGNIEVELSVAQ